MQRAPDHSYTKADNNTKKSNLELIMTNDPLVTIGIPTYNRPDELNETIRQIRQQNYRNLQIIICDNGGSVTSDTIALINDDPRFEITINDTNIGLLKNTEKVVRSAKGEFFCWFSDDDWHSPHFIELMLHKLIQAKDERWAICNFLERVPDGSVRSPYRNKLSKKLSFMTGKYRLLRLVNFYIRDQSDGKCNAFYGLFHTKFVKSLDFKKLSSNYTDYSMDNNIVFEAVKNSPVSIIHETLFSLTCDNVKNYQVRSPLTTIGRASTYISAALNETHQSLMSYNHVFYNLTILALFLPKILLNGIHRILKSFRVKRAVKCANWRTYKSLFATKTLDRKLLQNVTLVCVATKDLERSVLALKYSQRALRFKEALLLSHYSPQNISGIKNLPIRPFTSVEEWGKFIIYDLWKYVSTDYILLIHDDGFIINADSWRDEFLDYDFIGSPWPIPKDKISYRTQKGELIRVGNSVSLRSKKLLKMPTALKLEWKRFHGFFHEDGFINVQYREKLEENGIVFPDLRLASHFGREYCNTKPEPFIFHKWKGRNKSYPRFTDFE
ncbi:glycosyltransferase [Octadecabacter sp.]|nr:glycosyltransferase [Octadecabacter sp.]